MMTWVRTMSSNLPAVLSLTAVVKKVNQILGETNPSYSSAEQDGEELYLDRFFLRITQSWRGVLISFNLVQRRRLVCLRMRKGLIDNEVNSACAVKSLRPSRSVPLLGGAT
jgi:hypothetical protein